MPVLAYHGLVHQPEDLFEKDFLWLLRSHLWLLLGVHIYILRSECSAVHVST